MAREVRKITIFGGLRSVREGWRHRGLLKQFKPTKILSGEQAVTNKIPTRQEFLIIPLYRKRRDPQIYIESMPRSTAAVQQLTDTLCCFLL